MNIKITKEQFDKLLTFEIRRFLFGSQLHGIATIDSDFDYVVVVNDKIYSFFDTKAVYLPNIHSYQFDCEGENTQYVLMTETQFYRGLFSGDGNMLADIVLLSGEFENPMFLCRTYKIIKAYLGVAKRDLKLHGNVPKKRFHALRSLYMAEKVIDGVLPSVKDIKLLYNSYGEYPPSKESLMKEQDLLRDTLNNMLNNSEIDLYPKFEESNKLIQIMVDSNNIKEFKYK